MIGRSLLDGLGMFWQTQWALVLGCGLSGAVQAFVSRAAMQRSLGDHRPRTTVKESVFGTISSSCSCAASAVAKRLCRGGTSFHFRSDHCRDGFVAEPDRMTSAPTS